jgi:membrane fusion protein (multidrug efflux system)
MDLPGIAARQIARAPCPGAFRSGAASPHQQAEGGLLCFLPSPGHSPRLNDICRKRSQPAAMGFAGERKGDMAPIVARSDSELPPFVPFVHSRRMKRPIAVRSGLVAALILLCAACSGGADKSGERPPPEVGFVVVQPTNVPLTTELAGRTSAYAVSEVRPQVSGVIRARLFAEGSVVQAGQTLYQIDPSLYQASVDQAQANLASAEATAEAARTRASRYRPLADMEAVSRQDYTDAAALARQSAANVRQNRAQLETARINLHFTRVPAPITGRVGRSSVTQGALVTANQADPLATIQQLDPIYVDIQQSSGQLLALRRALALAGAASGSAPASAAVRLRLEDGSDYGLTGSVEFTEAVVDQSTGTVTLRARFPNPQGLLLPGMFVRAIFAQSIATNAFLVPQAAVSRDPQGNATVLVVGPGNKIVRRRVVADRAIGANWVVMSGLNAGDHVVTEGTSRAREGQVVRPVPAGTPQQLGNARSGDTRQAGNQSSGR